VKGPFITSFINISTYWLALRVLPLYKQILHTERLFKRPVDFPLMGRGAGVSVSECAGDQGTAGRKEAAIHSRGLAEPRYAGLTKAH
jgi:hypothetical protein